MADDPLYTNHKRTRHSYIHFYPENWLAGIAGLPRMVWSVYFEICLYNWDKAKPMPESLLRLTLSDMPARDGEAVLNALIDSDKVILENGGLYSPRAMEEGERALRIWQAKVEGGKKNAKASLKQSSKSAGRYLKDTSTSPKKRTSPKGIIKDTSKSAEGDIKDTSRIPRCDVPDFSDSEDTSRIPRGYLEDTSTEPRTKNQEPRVEKEEASIDASSKNQQHGSKDVFEATAAIRVAQAKADAHRRELFEGINSIAETWNAVALRMGWSQIARVTAGRQDVLTSRIAEHSAETIIAAINDIERSDYLTGKTKHKVSKPSFDWLMGEDVCARLIEGFYVREERSDGSDLNAEQIDIQRRRAENYSQYRDDKISFEEFTRVRSELEREFSDASSKGSE